MTEKLATLPTNCPVLRDAFETITAIAVEAVWLPNQAKAITLGQAQTALRDLHHRLPRLQDLRVFETAVTAYRATLRSSMQDGDTPLCDTTRARLAQADELLELVRNQSRTVIDPADPWRGLYHPSRLPARNADGEILCHPDVPMWADGREVSLRPLFLAQGFDLVVVEGEFSEEGMGSGVYSTAQELHDWNPEAPGGDWRLAWLGETEDGLAAWFVRPLAIAAMNRPTAASTLADVQPGGRVRLGDQAERARFEAFLRGNPLIALSAGTAWQVWQAALSAQPSPGGQGDAPLRVFSAGRWTYDGTGQSFGHEDMDAAAFVVYRDAALAARQPVGDQHQDDLAVDAFAAAMKAKMAEARAKGRGGWQDPAHCTAEDLSRMLREHVEKGDPRDVANFCMMLHQRGEAIAARQRVGEPEIWVSPGQLEELKRRPAGQGSNYLPTRLASEGNFTQPLYAAPPAQVVDLGPVRVLADHAAGRINHANNGLCPDEVEGHDTRDPDCTVCCALIDSQAVGNG